MRQHSWLMAGALAFVAAACSLLPDGPTRYYMMSDVREQVDGTWQGDGSGCESAIYETHHDEVTSTSGSAGDDQFVESVFDGETVRITISSSHAVLAERTYDEAFFKSGEVDVIDVTTSGGRVMRYKYWGGPICDPPLQDDPWD